MALIYVRATDTVTMKVCPTCNETYKDDDINFCLADGTTLLKKKGGKAAKASRRDVAALLASGQVAGTTVATTMMAAEAAGICATRHTRRCPTCCWPCCTRWVHAWTRSATAARCSVKSEGAD